MEAVLHVQRAQGVKGGLIAGLAGGAVMAMFMMAMNLAMGQDVWVGAKMAGMPIIGEQAAQPGFAAGPVMLGMMSHFAVSIVWGALFGLFFYGTSKRATVAYGAIWGIVVWLGMFYAVLPLVGMGTLARAMPVAMAVFQHILFGVSVAIAFLPFQRDVAE